LFSLFDALQKKKFNQRLLSMFAGQFKIIIIFVNASREENKSLSVFVLDTKMKEDNKIVLQRVGFEISRERQGLLLQSRKMAKRKQSF